MNAHEILMAHTGKEGGIQPVDWYKLRAEMSKAMALSEHNVDLDPVDAIQALMDGKGLKRSDIFSSKARASDVMNRKRPLTLALIQKLHFEHGLPAEVLIRPYRQLSD